MAKLKEDQKNANLFLPDGRTLNLASATDEELDKLSKTKGYEHLFVKSEVPEGTLEGRTYDEWTVKDLRGYADIEEITLSGKNKPEIWAELVTK